VKDSSNHWRRATPFSHTLASRLVTRLKPSGSSLWQIPVQQCRTDNLGKEQQLSRDEYMIKLTLQRDRESQDLHFIALGPCRRHRQPWLQIELPRWAGSEVLLSELSNVRSFSQTSQFCWVNIFEHIWTYGECHVNVMWMSCLTCFNFTIFIQYQQFINILVSSSARSWALMLSVKLPWQRPPGDKPLFRRSASPELSVCEAQRGLDSDQSGFLSWILDLHGDEFKTWITRWMESGIWNLGLHLPYM